MYYFTVYLVIHTHMYNTWFMYFILPLYAILYNVLFNIIFNNTNLCVQHMINYLHFFDIIFKYIWKSYVIILDARSTVVLGWLASFGLELSRATNPTPYICCSPQMSWHDSPGRMARCPWADCTRHNACSNLILLCLAFKPIDQIRRSILHQICWSSLQSNAFLLTCQ